MSPSINNTRRSYEEVARKLAEKINSEEFPNGSFLPSERELAEMFSVSRPTIREAVRSLQSSGLISVRDRARAKVTSLSSPTLFSQLSGMAQTLLARPNGVADFQEARMFFECGLARYAARYASPKEVDHLAFALAQNKKAVGDAVSFARTDLEFHNILAEIPRNPIFVALNTALSEWLTEQRTVGLQAPVEGGVMLAYRGHEEIYQAIAARDVEAADKAMADHLEAVSALYWRTVDGESD